MRSEQSRTSYQSKLTYYLVDWLPPDFGAVGQYATLFCREMAQNGHRVRLIGLSASDCRTDREQFESGQLHITRIKSSVFKKDANASRLLWAIRSNFRLIWEVLADKDARRADVLFTGSPPFMLFFAFLAKWIRGARLIYRITDFYPEVLFAAWGKRPSGLGLIEATVWFLRRRIDEFQVLGEDQRRLLIAGGIPPERIFLKRDVSPVPISGYEKPAAAPAELCGGKILLYSGNYGVAHEVDTVVQGLIMHHRYGSGRFGLWLNASGTAIAPLTERLRAERIPFAVSPPVPLQELPEILAAADVHLISLKPSFSGYVLPSKVYACLSSRRPILFVGPKSSDVHFLCVRREQTLQYEQVDAGNAEGFAQALERLAGCAQQSPEISRLMGRALP